MMLMGRVEAKVSKLLGLDMPVGQGAFRSGTAGSASERSNPPLLTPLTLLA
jgi:hypothetical protein